MESVNTERIVNSTLSKLNVEIAEGLGKYILSGSTNHDKTGVDCLFINSPIFPPLDDEFRVLVETLNKNRQKTKKRPCLIILLETSGGSIETVERLVSVMRNYYAEVSFVIPNVAYSAGTILVMSGDRIFMDYYSMLGPIDPQLNIAGNTGYGYLAKYKELIASINKADTSDAVRAELYFLTQNFEPAMLFAIEQAIEHGEDLIKNWLPKYKFKNWKKTESSETIVTKPMRKERAEKIAKALGNAEQWHSHGRGITMHDLSSEKIKLKIDNFGNIDSVNELIRHYHGLCNDFYRKKLGYKGFMHSKMGCRRCF